MARITFEVATRAVAHDLWIRRRGCPPQLLELDDRGRARADLPEGRYDLFWTLSGPPGCPFSVVGRQGADTVLKIAEYIPWGRLDAAGAERFGVKGRTALRQARDRPDADIMPFPQTRTRRSARPVQAA